MSQTKIYVGNLSYDTTEDNLQELFGKYGEISELRLVKDQHTGRSKGFAFITFADGNAAQAALEVNGSEVQGRRVKVNFAKEDNRSGGGGGRGRREWR
jgi:cold-inducible RNA-binding protein